MSYVPMNMQSSNPIQTPKTKPAQPMIDPPELLLPSSFTKQQTQVPSTNVGSLVSDPHNIEVNTYNKRRSISYENHAAPRSLTNNPGSYIPNAPLGQSMGRSPTAFSILSTNNGHLGVQGSLQHQSVMPSSRATTTTTQPFQQPYHQQQQQVQYNQLQQSGYIPQPHHDMYDGKPDDEDDLSGDEALAFSME
eukprot:UN02725